LFNVVFIAAIAAIWALSLLSLAFALPFEWLRPSEPAEDASKKQSLAG
jgi:hypothetical protein